MALPFLLRNTVTYPGINNRNPVKYTEPNDAESELGCDFSWKEDDRGAISKTVSNFIFNLDNIYTYAESTNTMF